MPCRSGCDTKSHTSYIECLRASKPQVLPAGRKTMSTERDLTAYSYAVSQGVQPEGTQYHQSMKALELSEAAGAAYNAETGGFDS